MNNHESAVKAVAAAVRAFYARQEAFRIYHGSTNSTRPRQSRDRLVDISSLRNVLKIDPIGRLALVEPNVPMDRLIEATMKHNLIPPVIMEFPGITVGGGYAGSAGESSSFKYGYFDEAVSSVEMVLANGEIVTASNSQNKDLFEGAAGAMGTLGITTLIELRLTIETVKTEIGNTANDYVDSILFGKDYGVVMIGRLTDEKPPLIDARYFSRAKDPWFYLHIQERMPKDSLSSVADYIPLAEYLFRWDRGGFWMGHHAFKYFPCIPFNSWTRWFLDDFMHTRMLYRAMHSTNHSFQHIVQDLSLPYSTAERFIDYSASELDIWPLWLCPLREVKGPTFHPSTTLPGPSSDAKPMLNIGLWGAGSKDRFEFLRQNRRLEQKLAEFGGRKVLYSHTYYTEMEFWSLYDKAWYDNLRTKYQAISLPSVYDKVNVDIGKFSELRLSWYEWFFTLWPIAGLVGIRSAIRSKDYLLHRKPFWRENRTNRDP
ncbi:hypothetical protein OCU04_006637 [Sclerotinia nivalis]|uniref:Delta(24)-sterol reductase n=1 Tax=Sclerotinia nivalis TaxID=352851 RepID=A0A9X0DI20_9HELO|nr:hypothetical protein OCU04_006637 [Sclerotinia nivalis]